jgi:xanthine dehydrogenase YagS FAD-binding subunit
MKPFEMVRVRDAQQASRALSPGATNAANPDVPRRADAKILAGGTDLLGEMKEYIETPSRLVNIKTIPNLGKMEWQKDGSVKLGALVTLTQLAEDKRVREAYPVLVQAIGLSAMPQVRNAATIAGNLCQRPRCWYYRDEHTVCLKKGGTKCYAVDGENQYHAILGGGPCYIVHPSDPAPALLALGASVVIERAGEKARTVPLTEFFVSPREDVHRENILQQNDVITHVLIPAPAANTRSAYVKEREKDSYDWALASCAAVITKGDDGRIKDARVVLGGVAPIPWRSADAEKALVGQPATQTTLAAAAQAALRGAQPLAKNAYKLPLTEVVVRRALMASV